jgi:putative transcriptional regulator
MAIIIRLDRILVERKMKLNELAERIGISNVNLSNLKTGKVRAIRFSTLDAICQTLHCQPGDILAYVEAEARQENAEDSPETE